MTLSGIISTKASKSPEKSRLVRGWTSVSQNTFNSTPEDDLDTFCDIISHLTSKYRPDFLVLRKLLDRTSPEFELHLLNPTNQRDRFVSFFEYNFI
jgi:hypothetical protein